MTSKSFSSKGLLWDTMRRNLWALVLSGVGFFLSLLLPVMMQVQTTLANRADWLKNLSQAQVDQNWQISMDTLAELLGSGNIFVKAALVVMAVVSGVALFAYLHARQKVDFYHSLPISRTRLFANNFLTGICCTFSTHLIVYALTIACTCALGCGEAVRWNEIGGTLLCSVIVFLLLYALTVLTTVVCGNTIITLLLLAWVFFSPMLVYMLKNGVMNHFYTTYVANGSMTGIWGSAFVLSPLLNFFRLHGVTLRTYDAVTGLPETSSALGLLIGYLIAAVVVTALALFLFRIRKSERAGTALAFIPAKLPVKVYMCLVMGVAFGIVFQVIAGSFWFWPGLVIGTVLFHWIIEIIYAFDFHAIFHKPLHLLIILAVLVAGMLCMKFDVTGYDTWLPDCDKLTAVDLTTSGQGQALTDPDNIDAVYRLAEIGCETTQAVEDGTASDRNCFSLSLAFQQGSRVDMRSYTMPSTAEVNALLMQIRQTAEYKQAKLPLFSFAAEDTGSGQAVLEFTDAAGAYMGDVRNDPDTVAALLDTMREETLAQSGSAVPLVRVELRYEDTETGSMRYYGAAYVTRAMPQSLALVEQITGRQAKTVPADLFQSIDISYSVYDGALDNVSVTDPADIQALLENAVVSDYMDLYNSIYSISQFDYGVLMEPRTFVSFSGTLTTNVTVNLNYPVGLLPVDVLEKYLPENADLWQQESGQGTSAAPATEAAS